MNKEELVFNLKKDNAYKSSRDFKEDIIKNLKIKDIDFKDVYARIINYQIKKYGESLAFNFEYSMGEIKKNAQRNIWRKSKRRNYESKRRYYD